jgi:hypothetical protein
MKPIHFTVVLAILGFVPARAFEQAASDGLVNTTLCNLVRRPELFDGKKVRARGVVRGGFETVTISDESCAAYVWLSWDTGTHEIEEEYEIAYIGSQSELAFPEKLDSKPVWSNNPICMKSKDDSGIRPGDPDWGVTPHVTSHGNHLVTSAWPQETSLTMSRVFSEIEFLDHSGTVVRTLQKH